VRLFDIETPSPWRYYFVCPPQLLATQRVQAFRTWIFEEVARFRALFEQTRRSGPRRQSTTDTIG
jgi:LysR family glycine cleavage system transcriptional activator